MRAITFGRAPAGPTHIHIADKYCSPTHCQIVQGDDGSFTVADLGSTNGTYIQRLGQPIRVYGPTLLIAGDRVCIGRTTLPWKAEA